MEQKKSVGIWIRVSTEDQAKGDSPEHHEKRARLYAEAMGWDVATVYHLEAMSGKSVMGYPETKRMLQDIHDRNITGLIFSKVARLARNTKELLEFADIFKKEDADLISLQESIDTSSPAGRMFYTMIAAMAQWEREEIASRVSASIPIRAKLGKQIAGRPSLGYKWENKQLVIDEQFAPVRKLVYELFLKYKRKKTVARILNEQGYRTRTNTKFSDSTVMHLLRDPMAKGERRINYTKKHPEKNMVVLKPVSEWVIVSCPPLVSEDVWNECNRLLDESLVKNRKQGPIVKHLLAGFVYCADCDKKMYVFHKTNSPTYRCNSCKNHIIAKDIEEIYHEQLKTFLLTGMSISEYLETINIELQEKGKLFFALSEERKMLSKKADTLIDMRMNKELTKESFAEKYKPLEERLKQIDTTLPELQGEIDFLKIHQRSSDIVLHEANDLYTQWETLSFDDKRTIVETITDRINVGKEDIHIKMSYLPPKQTHAAYPAQIDKIKPTTINQNPVKRQSNV